MNSKPANELRDINHSSDINCKLDTTIYQVTRQQTKTEAQLANTSSASGTSQLVVVVYSYCDKLSSGIIVNNSLSIVVLVNKTFIIICKTFRFLLLLHLECYYGMECSDHGK